MVSLNELMKETEKKTYNELVAQAQAAMAHLMPAFTLADQENNGLSILTTLILSAVAADGILTTQEYDMYRQITGLDDRGANKMLSMYDSKTNELADCFVDNMDENLKTHALMLILSFMAVDKKVSMDEIRLFHKLLA